ncbi:hypothetical protein UFOVP777_33 [uncultured Caudovirales phage]|uniref:Uncharacterized protein n=1 Tax=uncultured Caudovirales phage TaxID=2100421 RepID=A0A6J5NTE9_9CAUD|nr:hypothetical protein UFOVP777_33 [uncultured Caudovirales phage]
MAKKREGYVFEVEILPGSKSNPEDMALIITIFGMDQKLDIQDMITTAQARYYMSIRPDGSIPPVLRQQVVRILEKYRKRVVKAVEE